MAMPQGASLMASPDYMLGTTRSMVTMMQFNEQTQDYHNSLAGLQEDTPQYRAAIEACHQRGAERCVKVASMHRGLYVKAAQFIASIRGGTGDRGVPRHYSEALSVFTDHAPHKPVAEVAHVLKECMNLGDWPERPLDETCALKWIQHEPIASASLAQVHRATLPDGTGVCVKVQYPQLRREMASDFAVFKTMGSQIKQMSDGYDLMWVVEDFEKNLERELDFELEAASAEETAEQLAHLAPYVYVPKIYKSLSSSRVITMEYCDGLAKVNDPVGLRELGLDVTECADLICNTFAEMIFLHGRVHADPHAGNIYFRALDGGYGIRRPQLVVLDHGLYFDLGENDVRLHLCKYWKACCSQDSTTMAAIGQRFAGALHRFLPLILSPWFVFGGKGVSLGDIVAASKGQLPDTIRLRDVADFVVATRAGGANLVGLLHSLGYTRGLLEALNYPESRRISVMLKYAIMGDTTDPPSVPKDLTLGERTWIRYRVTRTGGQIWVLSLFARPVVFVTQVISWEYRQLKAQLRALQARLGRTALYIRVQTVSVANSPRTRVIMIAGSGAAFALSIIGAFVGFAGGATAGGAAGCVPALVTGGLSVPAGAVFGGSMGACTGAAAGAVLGLVGGGTVGGVAFTYRDPIRSGAAKTKARMRSVADATRSKVSRVTVAVNAAICNHKLQSAAASAAGGAAAAGVGLGAAGLVAGVAVGAACGVVPAFFTFGLSIPFGAVVGGGAGLFAGATAGGAAGFVGGGAVAYTVYAIRGACSLLPSDCAAPAPAPALEVPEAQAPPAPTGCNSAKLQHQLASEDSTPAASPNVEVAGANLLANLSEESKNAVKAEGDDLDADDVDVDVDDVDVDMVDACTSGACGSGGGATAAATA